MKKKIFLRLVVFSVLGLLALSALLVGLAFTPAVQTWAVRRAVADLPGVKIEIGRIAAGLHSVKVQNLHVTRDGLVLTLPSGEIELPLIAAVRGQVDIVRLTAKGWTVELTPAPSAPPEKPTTAFEGVFQSLRLPVPLTLQQADLEGDIIQPTGKTHLVLSGGGLGAGKEASFKLTTSLQAAAADTPVTKAVVESELLVRMDTPVSIQRIALNADATASGPKLAPNTKTHLTVWADRAATGESYAMIIRSDGRELVNLEAQLPADGKPFAGKWSLDASDTDLAPFRQFFAGVVLPVFKATGQGTLTASRDFKEITAIGKFNGSAEKLESLRPELGAMGKLDFAADFDVMQRGGVTRVTRLNLRFGGAQPVVAVETLQGFTFDQATRKMTPDNLGADLARLDLNGVPLAWAQSYLPKDLILNGTIEHGRFVAVARGGDGFTVRVADLRIAGTATQAGQMVWQGRLGLAAGSADYSPAGWQVEIPALTTELPPQLSSAKQAFTGILIGQASGTGQPMTAKAAARKLDLAILAQTFPVLRSLGPIPIGLADFDFAGKFGDKQEVALKLALSKLLPNSAAKESLPDLTLDLRADIAADGRITMNAPVDVVRGEQKSNFTLGGTFSPTKAGGWQIDAQAAGDTVYMQDLTAFADLAPKSSTPSAGPPWAGVTGTVKFSFKKAVFTPDYASSLAGTLTIDERGVAMDTRGTLNTEAPFTLTGGVTHTPGGAEPYALKADATLGNFDLGPLLDKLEARVNLSAQVTSRARGLDALAERVQGKVQLTSKRGYFRYLAVTDDKSGVVQSVTSTGATILGAMVGAVVGGGSGGGVAKAVVQIGELLREIRFDQLNLAVSRGAAQDLVLEDFTLISPEVRLVGRGQVKHVDGKELLDGPLTLKLQVAAGGTLGSVMGSVGLLEAKPDVLGYLPLAVELPELGGTLRDPNTNAFYRALAARAALKGADTLTDGVKKGAGGLLEGAGGLLNGLLK